MDQPAQGNDRKASRLAPVGTVQLEKFRVGGMTLIRESQSPRTAKIHKPQRAASNRTRLQDRDMANEKKIRPMCDGSGSIVDDKDIVLSCDVGKGDGFVYV